MKPPKIGRPSLSDEEKHAKITAVRLRDDERAVLEMAATLRGQKLSSWIRETLVKAAERQTRGNA